MILWPIRKGFPYCLAERGWVFVWTTVWRTRESNLAGDCFARGRKEGIDAAPFSSVVEPAVPLDSTVSHFLVQLGKRREEREGGGGSGCRECVLGERERTNELKRERNKGTKKRRKSKRKRINKKLTNEFSRFMIHFSPLIIWIWFNVSFVFLNLNWAGLTQPKWGKPALPGSLSGLLCLTRTP